MQILPPLRFRFTVEADVAAYGGDWRVWDERELVGLPGRDLIALEKAVDLALPVIIRGVHDEKTLPTMAAMWIVLHREGHPVAWPDFNPAVHLAEWEVDVPDPLESPDYGEDPTPDSTSSQTPPPSEESATSS